MARGHRPTRWQLAALRTIRCAAAEPPRGHSRHDQSGRQRRGVNLAHALPRALSQALPASTSMRRPLCLMLVLAATNASSAWGQQDDLQSAFALAPSCRRVVENVASATLVEAAESGRCMGIVQALFDVGSELQIPACAPDDATTGEAVLVILNYLDGHAERLSEPFVFLALDALHEAWPCTN
jgi:hypothetical protein